MGVYFYSQAINEAEAVEEASMVLSLCSGYSLPLGVYYDTEKVAGDTGRADGISGRRAHRLRRGLLRDHPQCGVYRRCVFLRQLVLQLA